MKSDNLKYVLREFVERELPVCLPRELSLPSGTGKVVGLAGVRRSGKTFLFFQTIHHLVSRGIDRRQIFYLNFEDDRLHPIRAEELDLVLRSIREILPQTFEKRLYLFLDEVQAVPGWERWVRRIQDTEDVDIFVTGSSSQLLTRDLSTSLRGRSISFEIFPLSFREYLHFRRVEFVPYSAESESIIRRELQLYLLWGGFPEITLADETLRPLILEEYSSMMMYRDLLERHTIRNEKLMRMILRHCFRNTSTLLNVSKLHRDFKSQGLSISKNTIFEYLEYLEDSFLIFLLPVNESSLRKQEHNPKKLHIIDTGLASAFKAYPMRDLGRKLETAVFLEIRRNRKDLYYFKNAHEIDLCDYEGSLFINSCWSMEHDSTLRRECESMEFGYSQWPSAKGYFLYHEFTPRVESEVPGAMPAWKFLLRL